MSETNFESWAILELMGHRKLAGMVQTETLGGAPFIRIDVYSSDEKIEVTQFYNPSSVYCITPTTKELSVQYTKNNYQKPIHRYELEDNTFNEEEE